MVSRNVTRALGIVGSIWLAILAISFVSAALPDWLGIARAQSIAIGAVPYHLAGGTTASTNSTLVGVAGSRTLYGLAATNTTVTVYYLRVYDSATAPTCSSATGAIHSYPIPAGTTVAVPLGAIGESYGKGIGFCVTGGGADTDNTNAATGVFINASYR